MKKFILTLAAVAAVYVPATAVAGRDEAQTQIIRKAIEAKQAARGNLPHATAMQASRPWWHPRFGSV